MLHHHGYYLNFIVKFSSQLLVPVDLLLQLRYLLILFRIQFGKMVDAAFLILNLPFQGLYLELKSLAFAFNDKDIGRFICNGCLSIWCASRMLVVTIDR